MTSVSALHAGADYNLVGQKLGRKGLETRERILAALIRVLDDPGGETVTLTSVAREASIGMTTLYLYFPDLGELLVAALERVMEGAEAAFIAQMREYWPEDQLHDRCQRFAASHLEFWRQNSGILHLRNSFADASDRRLLAYRWQRSRPLIELVIYQMSGQMGLPGNLARDLASVAIAGLERVGAMVTHRNFYLTAESTSGGLETSAGRLVAAQGRILELVIREQRRAA